jgi:hypothetical protein
VLTAPANKPVEELRLQAAERLGLATCSLCQSLFQRDQDRHGDFKNVLRAADRRGLAEAEAKERGLMWWLTEQASAVGKARPDGWTKVRRYLCPACTWALAPSQGADD